MDNSITVIVIMQFVCGVCQSSFKSKRALVAHIKGKHEMISHYCPQCDKNFDQKGNLNKHVLNYHLHTKYDCHECGV